MRTVLEHIRFRLLANAGLTGSGFMTVEPINSLDKSEWSDEFERLMRNRFIMGRFRYGEMRQAKHSLFRNHEDDLIRRAEEYKRTGNLELLVDLAAIAMVEFVRPSHPGPSWVAVDDGEHVNTNEGA